MKKLTRMMLLVLAMLLAVTAMAEAPATYAWTSNDGKFTAQIPEEWLLDSARPEQARPENSYFYDAEDNELLAVFQADAAGLDIAGDYEGFKEFQTQRFMAYEDYITSFEQVTYGENTVAVLNFEGGYARVMIQSPDKDTLYTFYFNNPVLDSIEQIMSTVTFIETAEQ